MSLKGKTLFITGGSRGIGLAIALRAAKDGANVTIAAKTAEPHPKLPGTIYTSAAEIEAAGGKCLPLMVDVRDEQSVAEAIARHDLLSPGDRVRSRSCRRPPVCIGSTASSAPTNGGSQFTEAAASRSRESASHRPWRRTPARTGGPSMASRALG